MSLRDRFLCNWKDQSEVLGTKPRELEAAGSWPAATDTPLYSGQGDDRRQSNF